MMCMSGTPKGMEASLSASFWMSRLKASVSPLMKGSMRLFRTFSRTSTLFCTGCIAVNQRLLCLGHLCARRYQVAAFPAIHMRMLHITTP